MLDPGRPPVVAIDCDLHRIHAWSSVTGAVGTSMPDLQFVFDELCTSGRAVTVLFEVASPTAYRDGKAAHHNLAKWMIWNIATAAKFQAWYSENFSAPLLVAPSSRWTRGYDVKVRHRLAKATGKNKDLRECESMIWSYGMRPQDWIPFPQYLENI